METSKRLVLHSELSKWVQNVYYQPPSTLVMKYPCIVYERSGIDIDHANNFAYGKVETYSINVLYKSVLDEGIVDNLIVNVMYCSFDNTTIQENLYNTSLTIKIK